MMLASRLAESGVRLRLYNSTGKLGSKLWRHLKPIVRALIKPEPIYVSLNSNQGIWLNVPLFIAASIAGSTVLIHYHAVGHLRKRSVALRLIMKLPNMQRVHIVLGEAMKKQIAPILPPGDKLLLLNNSGLVSPELLGINRRATEGPCVIGHLSNLCKEKGIEHVVGVAIAAVDAGYSIKLVVAGPIGDETARLALLKAELKLGDRFRYLGPVFGEKKQEFFSSIDLFLFPTEYRNEAEPLVLLEAMAANVNCVALNAGCIADDVLPLGGMVFDTPEELYAAFMRHLDNVSLRRKEKFSPRDQYILLAQQYTVQETALLRELEEILAVPS